MECNTEKGASSLLGGQDTKNVDLKRINFAMIKATLKNID
jgi:hypothetical protein